MFGLVFGAVCWCCVWVQSKQARVRCLVWVLSKGVKFGVKFSKQWLGAWCGCYARIRCKVKVLGAKVWCYAGAVWVYISSKCLVWWRAGF